MIFLFFKKLELVSIWFSLLWIARTGGPFIPSLKYPKPIGINKDKYMLALVRSLKLAKF